MSIHKQSIEEGDRLYFAYGSNLHLSQMAKRCPSSIFIGKATLRGYRWQINQRGVANVVESKHDVVEGLLFSVSHGDERSLDRSEGVSKGFYERCHLKVDFEPVRDNDFIRCKCAYVAGVLQKEIRESSRKNDSIRSKDGAGSSTRARPGRHGAEGHQARSAVTGSRDDIDEQHQDSEQAALLKDTLDERTAAKRLLPISCENQSVRARKHRPSRQKDSRLRMNLEHSISREGSTDDGNTATENEQDCGKTGSYPRRLEQVTALVYVSQKYTQDGLIREEYVDRMKRAVDDAFALGVSDGFLDRIIRPCLLRPKIDLSEDHGGESLPEAVSQSDPTERREIVDTDFVPEKQTEVEGSVHSREHK